VGSARVFGKQRCMRYPANVEWYLVSRRIRGDIKRLDGRQPARTGPRLPRSFSRQTIRRGL